MNIKPINNKRDHRNALTRIDSLWDAKPKTARGDELDVLTTLVVAYEQKQFDIEQPTPLDAIKFRMDQLGLEPKDLQPYLGAKSKVSEVLNRKRGLSLSMIRKLASGLNIPAANLIKDYPVLK